MFCFCLLMCQASLGPMKGVKKMQYIIIIIIIIIISYY